MDSTRARDSELFSHSHEPVVEVIVNDTPDVDNSSAPSDHLLSEAPTHIDGVNSVEDDANRSMRTQDNLAGGDDDNDDNRSVISDDLVPWNVNNIQDYPYNLVFDRLAALGNLTRQNADGLTIDPSDFEAYLDEGGVWTPNAVLREFQNGGFRVNHGVFRTLIHNPRIALETIITRPAPDSQRLHHQFPPPIVPLPPVAPALDRLIEDDESWLDHPNMQTFGRYTAGARSSHPTGQVPRKHETFEEDPANPGQWLVRFRRQLPNGIVYEQVDVLREFNATAVSTSRSNKVQTELDGEHERIPTFAKNDKGFWYRIESQPEVGGEFRRHYNVPPKDEAKQYSKASVVFIFRKYDCFTGQYTEQYKWGEDWNAWDRNISTFDINDTEICRVFNHWFLHIMEKYDHRYMKRETRKCWETYELKILRDYFNDLIADKGLMEAHSNAGWRRIVDRINKERDARNPNAGHRNANGVSAQAERHIYAPNVPRLGIQEWRQLGWQLRDFRKDHPGVPIPDYINMPRNCIPLDDITDKVAGGAVPPIAEYKISGITRKEIQRAIHTKILVSFENGQFKVSDRFGGSLVSQFFGQPAAASEDQTNELADEVESDQEEWEVDEGHARTMDSEEEWDSESSFEQPAP